MEETDGVIEGLNHLTFAVSDLDRMTRFLINIFDAEEICSSGDMMFSHAKETFFQVGGVWIALKEGESLPRRTYNHIASRWQMKSLVCTRCGFVCMV